MAVLQVVKCGKQELPESFAILKSETLIGRDPKCDICLSVCGTHLSTKTRGSNTTSSIHGWR